MKFFKIIFLIIYCLFCNNYANADTKCFIAADTNQVIKQEGNCKKRYPPCSTFKIAISLMGFDSGILIDETHPVWGYKSKYVDWLEKWKQPHNPTLWFANSCVWYSQVITRRLGIKSFTEYVEKFQYGNKDIMGDKGENNGLTNSWLSSSLAISPFEQIAFLQKLIRDELPVSDKAQEMTKRIMFIDNLKNGWKLYGKTGSGYQLNIDENKMRDKQVGWFVGFISKGKRNIIFAYLISDDHKHKVYASLRAKSALTLKLEQFINSD